MATFVINWVEPSDEEGTMTGVTMKQVLRLVEDVLNDGGAILSILPLRENS